MSATKTTVRTTSSLYEIDWKDFFEGLIMAVLAPILTIIWDSLESGTLEFNWYMIKVSAISGGVGYLIKKFFTRSKKIETKK